MSSDVLDESGWPRGCSPVNGTAGLGSTNGHDGDANDAGWNSWGSDRDDTGYGDDSWTSENQNQDFTSWSYDDQNWQPHGSDSQTQSSDAQSSDARHGRGGLGSSNAPWLPPQAKAAPVGFVSAGAFESRIDPQTAELNAANTFTAGKTDDDDDGDEADLFAPGVSKAFASGQPAEAPTWQSWYGPRGSKGLGKDRSDPYSHMKGGSKGDARPDFSGGWGGYMRESLRGIPGAPRPPPRYCLGKCGDQAPTNGGLAVLMVSEKPAIARAFAAALAPDGKFRNESTGSLPTYSFRAPWFGGPKNGPPGLRAGMPCEYRSTSTVGHIYSVDFPMELRRWRGTNPENLFDALTVRNESNPDSDLPQHLANEASRCHLVVLCLDCDREGESIGYECLDSVLPNLAEHPQIEAPSEENLADAPVQGRTFTDDPRVWRARFSSLAASDLQGAVSALQKPDALQARSVDARAEIDLKVGVALTRLITTSTRDEVGELAPQREEQSHHGALISYGPCQTPTLGFCVQQWDKIQRFAKEVVYTLDLKVKTPKGAVLTLRWKPPPELLAKKAKQNKRLKAKGVGKGHDDPESKRLYEKGTSRKEILEEFIERVGTGGQCTCEYKNVEEGCLERPTALNTVELLKSCSRELGIDPQKAMSVAEKLYLAGLLTYPRTETTRYPPSFNAKEYLKDHSGHAKWGEWCRYLLEGKKVQQPREGEDFGDHPPITPVWCASEGEVRHHGGQLAKSAVKLYELVVKRFLASVSPDVKYLQHRVIVDLEGFKFQLRGNQVTEWGYYRLAPGAILSSTNSLALLQCHLLKPSALEFAQEATTGMKLEVVGLSLRKVESKPPKLLTESELLTQMERNQIGTDASMPTHVSNVVARGYVEVQGPERRMCPTILGVWLVHGLQAIDAELTQAAVRARIEKDVTEVAEGKKRCEDVVAEALEVFRGKFHAVRDGMAAMIQELHATKEQKHLWEQAPDAPQEGQPEKKKKKKGADEDPEESFVIPPPLSTEKAAKSAAGKRLASAASLETQAPAKKAKTAAPVTNLEKLRKENKTLSTKLEIAQIRAENAELRLTDLERKFADLEARVTVLQAHPPSRSSDRGRGRGASRGRGRGNST